MKYEKQKQSPTDVKLDTHAAKITRQKASCTIKFHHETEAREMWHLFSQI